MMMDYRMGTPQGAPPAQGGGRRRRSAKYNPQANALGMGGAGGIQGYQGSPTGQVPGTQFATGNAAGGIAPVNGWGGYTYEKGSGAPGQPAFALSYGHRLYESPTGANVFESDTPGVYKQQGSNQMMNAAQAQPGREVLQNFYALGQDPNRAQHWDAQRGAWVFDK